MRDLLEQVESWFENGRSIALATVIRTWGSSPRPVGSVMAITDQGEISGSVSGGCVEGAVIDSAHQVLETGTPTRLHFGVANEEAWEVGLSCGGEIEIFLRKITPAHLKTWRKAVQSGKRFWIGLVIEGAKGQIGAECCIFEDGSSLLIPDVPEPGPGLIQAALTADGVPKSTLTAIQSEEIDEVFFQFVDLPRQLVLVGGVHIAIHLASLADTLGFEVIVVDPRRLFGSAARFPAVSKLLGQWPQEAFKGIDLNGSTGVVMLTHDPKIDDPATLIALESPAFYIGALGSRKTHQKRTARLRAQGVDEKSLARIHGPVGLDLGASTPEEIALAIMAEIIQVWHKRN